MTEASTTLLEFAFETLKLNRIDASAFADNKASCGMLKKIGFKCEGEREMFSRCSFSGEFRDDKIFGLL